MQRVPLSTWVRMWVDYIRYVIFLQQGESIRLFLGIFIFILSLYLLEHDLTSKFSPGDGGQTLNLVVILIIIKFLWDAYVTQTEFRSYFHIQRSILRNNLTRPLVQPEELEKERGFIPIEIPGNKADLVFSSSKINRYLQTTPISLTLSQNKKKHIDQYIKTHREILLQYLNHYFFSSLYTNRQFTNDSKLCLSTDINLNSKHVLCHINGYYDSFLTNQVSGTTLIIKDKQHTTITTEHIFPSRVDENGNKFLHTISSSQMNDHLGCSTLGFSADHKLIIWVQGSQNQFSKNLLAPTGSGSSNSSDLTDHNLAKTVVRTMERELFEETSGPQSIDNLKTQTLILGFYRWVTRGGKPEFSGITKLPGNSELYKPTHKETRKEKPGSLKLIVQSIEDLPRVIDRIRKYNNLSIPLYMCLYQLEEMYKNHKEELNEFLFNN